MIPPALRLLLRLRVRGFVRKQFLGVRDARKALLLAATYGGTLLPLFVFGVFHRADAEFAGILTGEYVSLFLAAVLLLAVVSSLFEFPIAYTPGEIQFLFPGPFSRTALLTYKFIQFIPVILYLGVIAATLLVGISWQWFPAFTGASVFGAIVLVTAVAAGFAAHTPVVRPILLATLLGAAIFAAYELYPLVLELNATWITGDLDQSVRMLKESRVYRAAILSTSPIHAMLFHPVNSGAFVSGLGAALAILAAALGAA